MENVNNKINITGEIVSDFKFSHEVYGEKFYLFDVSTTRTSGYKDIVPVMISERLMDVKQTCVGKNISISGELRSHNKHYDNKSKLILTVFVQEYEFIDADVLGDSTNQIELVGYLCKEPIYRTTPLGREIADVMLAVNRSFGKSDYIPCIVWGIDARYISGFAIGLKLKVSGRFQSREYVKHINGEAITRTTYEVSANKVDLVLEEEDD